MRESGKQSVMTSFMSNIDDSENGVPAVESIHEGASV